MCCKLQSALFDLLGGGDELDVIKPASELSKPPPVSNSNNQDLLDLLGLGPLNDPTPVSMEPSNNMGLILENNNANILPTVMNSQNFNFLSGEISIWRL